MAYFNFEIPATGKQYSVDFVTYSNSYRIADSGYKVLPVTATALTGSGVTVCNDAASWATANATLFTDTPESEVSGS